MPYIHQEDRDKLATNIQQLVTAGELNYLLTNTILVYLNAKGCNYQTINDIIGALEGAKLEFYRRIVVPYEDQKIEENGDVY